MTRSQAVVLPSGNVRKTVWGGQHCQPARKEVTAYLRLPFAEVLRRVVKGESSGLCAKKRAFVIAVPREGGGEASLMSNVDINEMETAGRHNTNPLET